jgi:hypothetical protein
MIALTMTNTDILPGTYNRLSTSHPVLPIIEITIGEEGDIINEDDVIYNHPIAMAMEPKVNNQ